MPLLAPPRPCLKVDHGAADELLPVDGFAETILKIKEVHLLRSFGRAGDGHAGELEGKAYRTPTVLRVKTPVSSCLHVLHRFPPTELLASGVDSFFVGLLGGGGFLLLEWLQGAKLAGSLWKRV